jgi:3-phosphoshikimate 1-carboxyvinyltransferase
MAALSDTADITLLGLLQNSFQGDSAIASLMEKFGVQTIFGSEKITLTKTSLQHDLNFNLNDQPDLAPALFATCGGLSMSARFEGIEHLQYKESHREKALQQELGKCGVIVERSGNGIHIHGTFRKDHYLFSTYLDHRMALALAPLAICCEQVFIEDPMVVKKSYPAFWDDLGILGFDIREKEA